MRRDGVLQTIEPQVFDLLLHLINNRDRVVSRDDLFAAIWKGRIVSESTLSSRINGARTAIGDNGVDQRLIKTHLRRGFRFVGEVRHEAPATAAKSASHDAFVEAGREATASTTFTLSNKPSIAVLPFLNMSGDPEQEYFADGVVEEIITALSRFSAMLVIARNSSFTYRGKSVDIKQVGRELGVRYVLEGSIRRSGQRARITGQLIDAESGSHVWADRFEGALDDIFELQDNVARSVVGAIASRLIDISETAAARKAPERWDTYDLYFRALSYAYKFDLASTLESKRLFQAALETDPAFALGYAGAARATLNMRHIHNQPISDGELAQALEYADRAVELAPEDEYALTCAAYVVSLLGGNPERGHELARRATALNVNSAQAWNARGTVELVLGELEAALEAFNSVMRLNPLDTRSVPFALFGIAAALLLLGQYKEGAAAARRMLLSFQNDIRGLFMLIGNLFLDGEVDETDRLIENFKNLFPHVRSFDLRRTYHVRKREHMATIERIIARIGLPE